MTLQTRGCALVACMLVAGCGGGTPGSLAPNPALRDSNAAPRSGSAGSLDPTFGNGGKVIVPVTAEPVAAIVTPDARIVLLGDTDSGGEVHVIRLLRNGKLDSSFGGAGIVTLNMYAAYAMTLQTDGKVLVGGIASDERHAELVRLQADGRLDSTFGSSGVVAFAYLDGSSNGVFVAIEQPNGEIVAGGFALSLSSDVELTSLARFDANGEPDTSFGANGIVTLKLVGGVTAIGLQSSGDILVCGGPFDTSSALVARFRPDGTLDPNDKGGRLRILAHTGSLTFEGANEFDLTGRLLRWTTVAKKHGEDVRVLGLLRDQSRDPNFHSRPFAFESPLENEPHDVEIAANGDLLVAGEGSQGSGGAVFGLARLLGNGALDGSFGNRGRVVTQFAGDAAATALAIAPDGKIVAAGSLSTGGSGESLAVARYLSH